MSLSTLIDRLRLAAFLDGQRMRAYLNILAVLSVAAILTAQVQTIERIAREPQHRAPLNDFCVFWVAAGFAADGHAAAAYDPDKTDPAVTRVIPLDPTSSLPFFYPPPALLLALPLALLPYLGALYAHLIGSYLALLAALRRQAKGGVPTLALAVMPAALMNALNGQNGAWSGAIFATAAVYLDTRPWLAGAVLGLLAYKPQLAVGLPLALAAARRWQAFLACGLTAALLCVVSGAAFGLDAWRGFLIASNGMRYALETDRVDWVRQLSAFTAMRLLGAPIWAAYTAQGLSAAFAIAALVRCCWRQSQGEAVVALAAAAATLMSPHIMDYDLPILAAGLLWAAREGIRHGFLGFEKLVLLAMYIAPIGARLLNIGPHIPLACPVLILTFITFCRRARRSAA